MESKLSKLQKRNTGAKFVALCPTMDLVALLNEDGQLNVHRTISWDRIMAKSIEIGDDAWGTPTSVSFSPSGNLLALGHARGQISIVNLESGDVMKAYDSSHLHRNASKTSVNDLRAIIKIAWVEAPYKDTRKDHPCTEDDLHLAMVSGIGNIYQGLKASVVNASDASLDTSPQFRLSDSAMPGSMLYAIGADGIITVYVSGLFPIFAFDQRIVKANSAITKFIYSILRTEQQGVESVVQAKGNLLFGSSRWSVSTLLGNYYDEHIILLLIRVKANAARLNSLLSTCGKRWKDAIRPLSAKINLLKSALAGYEMNMNPLQFLYSIAHCGLWHPVAVMSFATHWNEQGLTRTRTAIDVASKSIIQILHFDVTNCATTVMLQCLELLKVMEFKEKGADTLLSSPDIAELVAHVRNIVLASQQVLLTVDAAAREARRARDSMMLFLCCVREWHYAAQTHEEGADKSDRPKNAPSQSSPSLYIRLFELRKSRVEYSDPGTYVEYIVGTHLTPYFTDAPLPSSCTSWLETGDDISLKGFTPLEKFIVHLSKLHSELPDDLQLRLGKQLGTPNLSTQSLIQSFRYLNECIDATQMVLSAYMTDLAEAALCSEECQGSAVSVNPAGEALRKVSIPPCLLSLGYSERSHKESIFIPAITSDRTTSAASSAPRKLRYMVQTKAGGTLDLANSSIALFARPTTGAPSGWELALLCLPEGNVDGNDDNSAGAGAGVPHMTLIAPSVIASGACIALGTAHLDMRLTFKASSAAIDPVDPHSHSADSASEALSLICVAEASSSKVRVGASKKFMNTGLDGHHSAESDAECELLLFKIPLHELQWFAIPTSTSSITSQGMVSTEVECHAGRSLALKSLQAMEVSAEKGVAAALDTAGRLVIVDLVEDG